MQNQQHLFQIPEGIHYLNGAYMSPLLKSVEEAGMMGMIRKRNPSLIKPHDFFADAETVRQLFGTLVNCPAQQVAIIASASYGLATAVQNLPSNNGNHALVVADEFPSGYFAIQKWCEQQGKTLKVISPPIENENRAKHWNEYILENINHETAAIVISSIHWTDGTRFDLAAIGERCKMTNTRFIVDGTQSVGAMPIDVTKCQIDALICSGYKWLLGPYGIGIAYFGECFNDGKPLEESWKNRLNAVDFAKLCNYETQYQRGAGRYHVGEYGNFILLPMLQASLSQILAWNVENMQAYCRELTKPLLDFLQQKQIWTEAADFRSEHLFGLKLATETDFNLLLEKLAAQQVFVSLRAASIRISTNVYNTPEDINALIKVLDEAIG